MSATNAGPQTNTRSLDWAWHKVLLVGVVIHLGTQLCSYDSAEAALVSNGRNPLDEQNVE